MKKIRVSKKGRELLDQSIAHWRENVRCAERGEPIDTSMGACALCGGYYRALCRGCAIYELTGFPYCQRTPYYRAAHEKSPEACRAMLRFLYKVRKSIRK
jgi:hypothetical protein